MRKSVIFFTGFMVTLLLLAGCNAQEKHKAEKNNVIAYKVINNMVFKILDDNTLWINEVITENVKDFYVFDSDNNKNDIIAYVLKTNNELWEFDFKDNAVSGNPVKITDDVKTFYSDNGYTFAAIKEDNTLWYWGSYLDVKIESPVKIFDDVKQVQLRYSSAALKNDGTLWVWGGDESKKNTDKVAAYQVDDGVAEICDYNAEIIYTKDDGSIWRTDIDEHYRYTGKFKYEKKKILDSGEYLTDAMFISNGTVYQNGLISLEFPEIVETKKIIDNIKAVKVMRKLDRIYEGQTNEGQGFSEVQYDTVFFVRKDGKLFAMGDNTYNQISTDKKTFYKKPALVTDNVETIFLDEFKDGDNEAIFIKKADNYLYGYGANDEGQLGIEDVKYQITPQKIIQNVDDVISRDGLTLAKLNNNELWGWGNGQKTPIKLTNNVKEFSIVDGVGYMLNASGELYNWSGEEVTRWE